MGKVSQLPTEIWLDIARYIPKSQLLQLKSLNSVFLHCAMDIDWKKIGIDMSKPDQTDLVLSRMAPISHMTYRRRESTPLEFSTQMVQLFDVLPLLNNLTCLKLELLLIPFDLIQALFQAITNSPIARNIEKLSLTGHSDVIAPLAECPNPETTFANLSALDITFFDRNNDDDPECNSDTNNILSLARFILSLSLSLQHLTIVSMYDVSPLFTRLSQPLHHSSSLTPLPNLKSVMLTPVNFSFQPSPQSVHRFLHIHSTNIQHLQLSLVAGPWPLYGIDEVLEKWLSDFVNDSGYDSNNDSTMKSSLFFPNLQTLDIFPPDTPIGLSAMLVFIKRTAPTLSSLRIRCELSVEGVEQVISKIKPNKLKSLQLNMRHHLNIPFIEFLAVKLPKLQKLYLKSKSSDQRLFMMLLENRRLCVSEEDDCLTSWKLRHLSIEGIDEVTEALAAFIPSVVVLGDEDESDDESGG